MATKKGRQTFFMSNPPSITNWFSTVSKKEGEGPLGKQFDLVEPDSKFGQDSWEKAESVMMNRTISGLLSKSKLTPSDIDLIFAGDLINQCTDTTFALKDFFMPFYGVYGACSTMAESAALAALLVDTNTITKAIAATSSHFCSAERQYRFPLEYGGVRTPNNQWTATASGAILIEPTTAAPFIKAVTTGKIEDKGIKDQNNMGAAMAPAAASTLVGFFRDTNLKPTDFNLIVTGDLGFVGSQLLYSLMKDEGFDISDRHNDCGMMIYDRRSQDVHAGGSGCGCSASVLGAFFLPAIKSGTIQNMLFMPTGALLSPLTVQQKESIPCIAHLLWLSSNNNIGGL